MILEGFGVMTRHHSPWLSMILVVPVVASQLLLRPISNPLPSAGKRLASLFCSSYCLQKWWSPKPLQHPIAFRMPVPDPTPSKMMQTQSVRGSIDGGDLSFRRSRRFVWPEECGSCQQRRQAPWLLPRAISWEVASHYLDVFIWCFQSFLPTWLTIGWES